MKPAASFLIGCFAAQLMVELEPEFLIARSRQSQGLPAAIGVCSEPQVGLIAASFKIGSVQQQSWRPRERVHHAVFEVFVPVAD